MPAELYASLCRPSLRRPAGNERRMRPPVRLPTRHTSGDDAYFMTQMAAWIKSYASGPVIYWNYAGGTLPLDIPNYTSGGTPDATAAFRSAFMD